MDPIQTLTQDITNIKDTLNDIRIELARKNEADLNREKITHRLIKKTDENSTKIVDLEVQIARINTKLMIFGVMAPIITGIFIKFYFHSK